MRKFSTENKTDLGDGVFAHRTPFGEIKLTTRNGGDILLTKRVQTNLGFFQLDVYKLNNPKPKEVKPHD